MKDLNFSDTWITVDDAGKINGSCDLKWSNQDKKLFNTLVSDDKFQKLVRTSRIKAEIEDNLLSDEEFERICNITDTYLEEIDLRQESIDSASPSYIKPKKDVKNKRDALEVLLIIQSCAREIIKNFNLKYRWRKTLEVYIATNKCIPPEYNVEICFYPKSDKVVIDGNIFHSTPIEGISIIIREPISPTAFSKLITKRWPEVETRFKSLPIERLPSLTPRDFYIMDLKDNKDYSFKEVANAVIQEFKITDSALSDRINAESMKTAYHSAKKKIKLKLAERECLNNGSQQ